MPASLSCDHLSFAWPDGRLLLQDASADFNAGLNGLIGLNGTGKSTLLRLLLGERTPMSGTVERPGSVGYLPQDLTVNSSQRVDDALGIAGMSGGEVVLLALAALFLAGHRVLLLDEPTNNLDVQARNRLYSAVQAWSGVVVVVSHDRELLERCDQIVEVRDRRLRSYGGNFGAYAEAVSLEQKVAERMVRSAESDLRRQRAELIESQTKVDRRQRYGQKAFVEKRQPRAKMKELKRSAQVSAAKLHDGHVEDVQQARLRVEEAEQRVRHDDRINVDLSAAGLPAGREVLSAVGLVLRNGVRADLDVRGPERIALVGPNGCGKTTLLDTITGTVAPESGSATIKVPYRALPQRLALLPGLQPDGGRPSDGADLTVLAAVAVLAPSADVQALRARLARFLLGADVVNRAVSTLSGGELFRATLAALMLAEPSPQLLILDEPTNNLDLASLAQLTAALIDYPGALLIVSHDHHFLAEIGIQTWWRYRDHPKSFVAEPT